MDYDPARLPAVVLADLLTSECHCELASYVTDGDQLIISTTDDPWRGGPISSRDGDIDSVWGSIACGDFGVVRLSPVYHIHGLPVSHSASNIISTMADINVPKPAAMHVEGSGIATDTGKIHNGDAALALFDNLDEMHEGFEPGEEKRLVRKIDLMILPFLSVCYAFYYVCSI